VFWYLTSTCQIQKRYFMFRKNVVAISACQTRPSSRMGQSLQGYLDLSRACAKTTPAATLVKVALHFSKSFAEGNTQIFQEHTWIIKTII